jgi:hypothetical protein
MTPHWRVSQVEDAGEQRWRKPILGDLRCTWWPWTGRRQELCSARQLLSLVPIHTLGTRLPEDSMGLGQALVLAQLPDLRETAYPLHVFACVCIRVLTGLGVWLGQLVSLDS